jgi:transposase InsO family protein
MNYRFIDELRSQWPVRLMCQVLQLSPGVSDTGRDRPASVTRRLPGEGLVAHSDRGSQHASDNYQRLLELHGIACSMSRRGDRRDNAPMVSFFASLKKELVHQEDYRSRAEA